jgi:lysophospholipase L1-like esterase
MAAGGARSVNAKRVLVFGDSNAWGFWVPERPGAPLRRIPFAQRWAGVAQAALGPGYVIEENALPGRLARGERQLGGLEPAAYDGARTLLPAMVLHLPLQLVVLALGTNDLLAEPTPSAEDVCARIMALAGAAARVMMPIPLEGMPAPARVLVLSPVGIRPDAPDRADPARAEAERARLAGLLRDACAAAGHAFADAARAVPVPGPDGVHFGPAENAALGALAARAIREALA